MHLHSIDGVIVAGYCIGAFGVGAYSSRRASTNIKELFVAGGELSWWLAGVKTFIGVGIPSRALAIVFDTPNSIRENADATRLRNGVVDRIVDACA